MLKGRNKGVHECRNLEILDFKNVGMEECRNVVM